MHFPLRNIIFMEDNLNKTLVIMAAGIGSRYSAGIKQLAKMTENNETIIDFSVYDAIKNGFNKVIFIIRKDLEKDFREVIGDRISRYVDIDYAFQELDDLPEGFEKPEGRIKPWGTVHALLVAKDLIDSPFLVINADDFYGEYAFKSMSEYLEEDRSQDDKFTIAMCGYKLKNTLSDNGKVTRGISIPTEDGHLKNIIETKGIMMEDGKLVSDLDLSEDVLNLEAIVSMNTWAAYPELLDYVEDSFHHFLEENKDNLDTCEYVLPSMMDKLLSEDKADIRILPTNDKWIGITYKADTEPAREEFRQMIEDGVYPAKLWD